MYDGDGGEYIENNDSIENSTNITSESKLKKILPLVLGAIIFVLLGVLGYLYASYLPQKIEDATSSIKVEKETLQNQITELQEKSNNANKSLEEETLLSSRLKQDNMDISTSNLVKDQTIKILREMNILLLQKSVIEGSINTAKNAKQKATISKKTQELKKAVKKIQALNKSLDTVEITVMDSIKKDPTLIPSFDSKNNSTEDLGEKSTKDNEVTEQVDIEKEKNSINEVIVENVVNPEEVNKEDREDIKVEEIIKEKNVEKTNDGNIDLDSLLEG